MPTKSETIPCACCHGKGQRIVSDEYSETLAVLRRLRRATCAEIAAALRIPRGRTLIHKRIARMEQWHLVRRTGQKLPAGQTDPRKRAWVFEAA